MYNIIFQLYKCFIIFSLFNLFILPNNLHIFNLSNEIFPALDLIIIYYLSTYKKIYSWQLLVVGLFLDQLYSLPIGLSSIILIIADISLNYVNKLCLIKKYETNIIIFCGYAFFTFTIKYFLLTILSVNYIEGTGIIFYFLTTIFSYPIMYVLLEKSLKILGQNAE